MPDDRRGRAWHRAACWRNSQHLRRHRVLAGSTDPPAMQTIAVPILLGEELQGAAAITLRNARADDPRQALRQLQWGTAWIRERLRQARSAENDRLLERTRAALN